MAPPGSSPSRFTALELAAAEHLIQLSESSSSGAAAFGPASVASAASSSSSPRSVNAPPPAVPGGLAASADEDEQEVGGCRRRRNKRYRPIAEIYAATEPKLKPKAIGRKDRPKPAAGAAAGGVVQVERET